MEGRSRISLIVLIVLVVPLVMVGCKGTRTAEIASLSGSKDHEHQTDQSPKAKGVVPPGEELPPSQELSTDAMEQKIAALKSKDDRAVIQALQDIQHLESPSQRERVRGLVRELLTSKNTSAEVRTEALRTWRPWVAEDLSPVIAAAESPYASVREAVADLLRGVSDPAANQVLQKLKSDTDSSVRAMAAEVLAEKLRASKSEEAIEALIADLGHPDGDRSAQAGMKLEQRGRKDRRVVDKLIATLKTSPNPHQRHSCATLIALTCAGTNPGQKKFASSVRAVYRQERNPDPAYEVGVEPLIEALEHDPEPMVREAAAFGLGMIGSEKAAPALGKALSDPDEHVRRRAAAALIIVPPDKVEKQLIHAAKDDPSPIVRRFAVEAMAGLSGTRAGDAVMLCLLDPDPEVRRYACEVLKRIGTRRQTQALVNLFEDPDEEVRWKAVDAVAQFADPEAAKPLMAALTDPSPRVALAAERGVHRLGIGARVLTKAERVTPRKAAPEGSKSG
ncbi:MAG: HEAT repeat domain-containing protein [Candidatus Zipacnadales bacterium]